MSLPPPSNETLAAMFRELEKRMEDRFAARDAAILQVEKKADEHNNLIRDFLTRAEYYREHKGLSDKIDSSKRSDIAMWLVALGVVISLLMSAFEALKIK